VTPSNLPCVVALWPTVMAPPREKDFIF
jgi:hypothetical protein